MSEQFKIFLSQLSETNATLDYFTDFKKIKSNINKIAIKLNQLNYLIGKENLKEAINELYEENPKVFEVLDILIAIRKNKNAKTFNNKGEIVLLDTHFTSPELILEYIEETGLAEVFRNKDVTNLVDYVFGIEVGLDTNARKNRGGDNMSKAVSLIFDKAGIFYKKEVNNTIFTEIISLGADVKRFDFVIKTKRRFKLRELSGRMSSVYALINPLTDKVFYVGSTACGLSHRASQHYRHSSNPSVRAIMRQLMDANKRPVIKEICKCPT